jgi:hypothetical protein
MEFLNFIALDTGHFFGFIVTLAIVLSFSYAVFEKVMAKR